MIIDFHTHVYPEAIAEKAIRYIGDFYGLPMHEKGTLSHLKAVAKASGTTHVVLLGVAVIPLMVHPITDQAAELKRLESLELSEEGQSAILYENAAALLGIDYA